MFFTHLKLFGSLVPINYMSCSCPLRVYQGKPSLTLFTRVGSFRNHLFPSLTLLCSPVGQQCPGVLLAIVGPEKRKVVSKEYLVNGEAQRDRHYSVSTDCSSIDETEIQRRRNIGLANKGKVPWNKGRRHSEETRERIQQRTREALNDPKVRKKMSECPRSHSHITKAKIKAALQNLWEKRLKRKRSEEKVFQLWADNIANAAKVGGNGQLELEWDSYEKRLKRQRSKEKVFEQWADNIANAAKVGGNGQLELEWNSYEKQKKDMVLQQQALSAKKAKGKESACVQAKLFTIERSERNEQLAKKKQEQKKRVRVEKDLRKKRKRKSMNEKEEIAVIQELSLKERLTKIHNKRSIVSQLSSEHEKTWKKLDLKIMEVEQSPREVISLADQIRLAKVKRIQHATS